MTNLIDIYEAMGGVVNEDRTSVQITPPAKPFKIELLVVLSETEIGPDGEFVTFDVLVDDSHIIEKKRSWNEREKRIPRYFTSPSG